MDRQLLETAFHAVVLLPLVVQHLQGHHFLLVSRQRQVQIFQAQEDGRIQQPADDGRADAGLFFGLVAVAPVAGEHAVFICIFVLSPSAGGFQHAIQPRPALFVMKGKVTPHAVVQTVQQPENRA